MLNKIAHSKSKTFLAFCFCFLSGVTLWSLIYKKIGTEIFFWSLLPFLFLLPLVWKNKMWRFLVFCAFSFLCGIFRVSVSMPIKNPHVISFYNEQKKTIIAQIFSEPDVRIDGVKYIARVQKFETGEKIQGKIFFEAPLYPRYRYGDVLKLTCFLQTPQPIEDFRYDLYLAKVGVYSICSHPNFQVQETGKGNVAYSWLLQSKESLATKINILWHEPYASFVAGILYGYRGGLGALQNDFNRTGVTHIVAVSGFNITLIATIFSSILIALYIPRKKTFWIVVSAITVFVIFVGASGSVVRAGLMGFVVLLSQQMGRSSRAFNSILFATVLMVLQNPLVLLFDAGFQLSVLSTMGLIYLSPFVQERIQFFPKILGIQESLSSTLSAIVITLPLILYQFGRLSLVAPLVNILILPVIPIAMGLGFAALTLSFLYLPLGILVSYFTFFVLAYVVFIVQWFSKLSFASIELHIPLWAMILLYGMIGWFYVHMKKKKIV